MIAAGPYEGLGAADGAGASAGQALDAAGAAGGEARGLLAAEAVRVVVLPLLPQTGYLALYVLPQGPGPAGYVAHGHAQTTTYPSSCSCCCCATSLLLLGLRLLVLLERMQLF